MNIQLGVFNYGSEISAENNTPKHQFFIENLMIDDWKQAKKHEKKGETLNVLTEN